MTMILSTRGDSRKLSQTRISLKRHNPKWSRGHSHRRMRYRRWRARGLRYIVDFNS